MAVHYDGSLTIATFSAFGINFRGFNSDVPAGSVSPTAYRGSALRYLQWSTNLGLQFAIKINSPNGGFGYILVNGVKYMREDATFVNWDGVSVGWQWPSAPQPYGTSGTVNFDIGYEDPDFSVSVSAPSVINSGDSSIPVTVNGIDSPYTGLLYGVALNGNDLSELKPAITTPFATTTGAVGPSVTFEITSNLPTIGSSRTYYLYAARNRPTGGAGSNFVGDGNEEAGAWVYAGITFTVSRESTPSALGNTQPLLEAHGLLINDNFGNIVTSFSTESMMNRVFTSTFTTSSSGVVNITGVPTAASNANSIVIVNINSSGNTPPVGKISTPGTVQLSRSVTGGVSGVVSVLMWKDIQPIGHGMLVKNGLGEGIINENTISYGVSEVLSIDPTATSLTPNVIPGTQVSRNVTLTLSGNYPISSAPPLVAIKSSHADWIIKPFLYSSNGTTYNRLYLQLPREFSSGTVWKIAICIPSDVTTPQSYGSNTYGMIVRNASGVKTWDSGWKQAIIQHVQDINVFTQGVVQNGTYDIETGYDGVIAPVSTASEAYILLTSTSQTVNVSTRRMDPANTFISFNTCSGSVRYNGGEKLQDGAVQYNAGGGTHYPAVRVNSSTSASIGMFRITDYNPAGVSSGIREATSSHPSGFVTFLRIPGV